MAKLDIPIGEVFEYQGQLIMAVPAIDSFDCLDCVFTDSHLGDCPDDLACTRSSRADNQSVIFVLKENNSCI